MTRIILSMAALCFALGAAMYHVALEAQTAEKAIAELRGQIADTEVVAERYEFLWAKATNAQRLRELAARHLTLQPIRNDQYASVDALPYRGDVVRPELVQPALPLPVPVALVAEPAAPTRIALLQAGVP